MKIDQPTEKKIHGLQILEQQLQSLTLEKQTIQVEYNEISNALDEVKNTKEEVYKIVGGIMLKAEKDALIKELQEKKKLMDIRITSLEKQEKQLEEKSSKLREEINATIKQS